MNIRNNNSYIPNFTALYATKGSFERNEDFAGYLIEDHYEFRKQATQHPERIKLNMINDNVYQFDIIQLSPRNEKDSIQLVATNESAPILSKFANENQYKFDFNLLDGEQYDCFEISKKNLLEMGKVDEYLDCILERKKLLSSGNGVFEISKKVVRELRKSTQQRLGYIPILDTQKALDFCKNYKFNFAKGIVK